MSVVSLVPGQILRQDWLQIQDPRSGDPKRLCYPPGARTRPYLRARKEIPSGLRTGFPHRLLETPLGAVIPGLTSEG